MADYSYSCPVCESTVNKGTDICLKCGCPAIVTSNYDFDMAGQSDQRFHFSASSENIARLPSYLEIWHKDRWYRVVKKDKKNVIKINELFVPLKHGEHGQYYID